MITLLYYLLSFLLAVCGGSFDEFRLYSEIESGSRHTLYHEYLVVDQPDSDPCLTLHLIDPSMAEQSNVYRLCRNSLERYQG